MKVSSKVGTNMSFKPGELCIPSSKIGAMRCKLCLLLGGASALRLVPILVLLGYIVLARSPVHPTEDKNHV